MTFFVTETQPTTKKEVSTLVETLFLTKNPFQRLLTPDF